MTAPSNPRAMSFGLSERQREEVLKSPIAPIGAAAADVVAAIGSGSNAGRAP